MGHRERKWHHKLISHTQTFINLTTGTLPAPPQTWAYTNITKTEWDDHYKKGEWRLAFSAKI